MKIRIIIFLLISNFCLAQNEQGRKFELTTGLEYRITPFNFKKLSDELYYSDVEKNFIQSEHLSGISLNISLDWFFLKKMSFGITQSFRYDEMFYEFSEGQSIQVYPKMKLLADTELTLKYYYNLNENNKIFGILGYGFMNNNSHYYEKKILQKDINGNVISYATYNNDLSYKSLKLGLGYRYKSFETSLGMYIVEKNQFPDNPYNNDVSIGIPFLRLNYNILKF